MDYVSRSGRTHLSQPVHQLELKHHGVHDVKEVVGPSLAALADLRAYGLHVVKAAPVPARVYDAGACM
jgi:hypothetical protein